MALPDVSIQSPVGQAAAKTLFAELDIEMTPDNIGQFMVFMRALKLYNDRSASYGQAWKQYGALSALLSAARKVDRMMALWWFKSEEVLDGKGKPKPLLHKDHLDDPFDLLSYTAFFIRLVESANLYGYEQRRPNGV